MRRSLRRPAVILAVVALAASPALSLEPKLPARPGWLGLGFIYHVPSGSRAGWIHVKNVEPGGPAATVGIAPNDVITAIDGRRLWHASEDELFLSFTRIGPGHQVSFDIARGTSVRHVRVKAVSMTDAQYELWRLKFNKTVKAARSQRL